jgi:RNase adapter protein RapZ
MDEGAQEEQENEVRGAAGPARARAEASGPQPTGPSDPTDARGTLEALEALDAQRAAAEAADGQHAPELVIITGMSGAGRSTAAKVFEDLGWYVVDNLAPTLIAPMIDLVMRENGGVDRLAFVVDVRGRSFFDTLRSTLDELDSAGLNHRIVFLESDDDVLVRRYENVRRPHPLQGDGRIVDGLARERQLLRELRGEADLVIDTSVRNVHELRATLESAFADPGEGSLRATVMSFGFKYGLPVDADLVADVRFLPNPHWVPELRPRTGQDPEVSGYVLSQHGAKEFLDRYAEVLTIVTEGYRREGKRYMTLAVGCTGGKHRSVAMAEQIAARLSAEGVDTVVVHRDMGRE